LASRWRTRSTPTLHFIYPHPPPPRTTSHRHLIRRA
jgi:hypothetical protein